METEAAAVRRDQCGDQCGMFKPASPTRPRGELPGAYGASRPLPKGRRAEYTRELAARKEEPSI